MNIIGAMAFPETPQEAKTWMPMIQVRAIASRVLCVASSRVEGTWAAYCDSVPGANHNCEFREVLRQGCKLQEHVARAVFPQFAEVPYAE